MTDLRYRGTSGRHVAYVIAMVIVVAALFGSLLLFF